MVEQDKIIRGSCLRRAVAYEVSGRLSQMWHCHYAIPLSFVSCDSMSE
jgi:hypothetical protein